jgi:hypothetical protein
VKQEQKACKGNDQKKVKYNILQYVYQHRLCKDRYNSDAVKAIIHIRVDFTDKCVDLADNCATKTLVFARFTGFITCFFPRCCSDRSVFW